MLILAYVLAWLLAVATGAGLLVETWTLVAAAFASRRDFPTARVVKR